MKRIYAVFIPVFAIAISWFVYKANHKLTESASYFGDVDAAGSDEDANARANYDWMMLHDPATGKIPPHIREKELAFAATLPNDADMAPMSRITTGTTWQERGPWNVGGRTRAFAIDVTNENNLIAGTTSGGMWR